MNHSRRAATLGLLVDDLQSRYQMRLLSGARRAARRRGARIATFLGGRLNDTSEARFDSSFLFDLATPISVDGIISVSAILASEVGSGLVRELCSTRSLPVVSVGPLAGFPSVTVSNALGMRQIVEHAVLVHQRTSFAFVGGPRGNTDSQERELALVEALRHYTINLAPRLVVPGDFLEASGFEAVGVLLDTRSVRLEEVDCIVAANDLMAKGVIGALAARGVRVPEDIIVFGFDDDDVARSLHPALSTVAQPIEQLGAQAVNLLLDLIAGETVRDETIIATDLIVRGSCGCAEPMNRAPSLLHLARGRSLREHAIERKTASLAVLSRSTCEDVGSEAVEACLRLALGTGEASDLNLLEDGMERAARRGFDPLRWHDVVQPFDDALSGRDPALPEVAEYRQRLTHLNLRVSRTVAALQVRENVRGWQLANSVRVVGNGLVCAQGLRGLGPVLHTALPGLGVDACYVCLFEGANEGRRRARVLVRHRSELIGMHPPLQRIEELWSRLPGSIPPPSSLNAELRANATFAASDLLPPDSNDIDGFDGLVVHPLVFGKDALGYVLFSEPQDASGAWVLDAIAGHLSAAIYAIQNAERLQQARDVAQRAYEAKSEFIAVMSHEIRTPMTGILGQLELCMRGDLSSDQRRGLELARGSGRTLLRIVNDLLDYSKIEAQRLELERTQFKLDDVWFQVIGACGVTALDKGLELVIDVDPDAPAELVGDPLRLGQVLVNLVGNAIKFSSRGDIVIRVRRASGHTEGEHWLSFAVGDSGIGMSPEQIATVFNAFTQGDSSTTRHYGGTGLGLTICQRLVRLMGGELVAESALGQGSVFSFEAQFKAVEGAQFTTSGHAGSVLVVDPSTAQQRAICRAFAGLGFYVDSVDNLKTARLRLDSLEDQAIDLVLIDHRLLVGSKVFHGGDTKKELGDWSGLLAIMLPHSAELAQMEQGVNGRAAVIAKPLVPSTVRGIAKKLGQQPNGAAKTSGSMLGHTVLVGMSERSFERELVACLTAQDFDVRVVHDGTSVLGGAAALSPIAVILSAQLHGIDGPSVARTLRADSRLARIPIIGLCEGAAASLRERCLAAGMSDCIDLSAGFARLSELAASWQPARNIRAVAPSSLSHSSIVAVKMGTGAELDTRGARARLGGDESLYRRLLRRFVDTHYTAAQAIREAVLGGDWRAAEQQAHVLRSAADIVGANTLRNAANVLEIVCRRGPNAEANTLVADLQFAASITLTAAKEYLSKHSDSGTSQSGLQAIVPILNKLDALLREHDTSAVDCLEELRENMPPSLREPMRRLDARIRAYDFEGAREQLAVISQFLTAR